MGAYSDLAAAMHDDDSVVLHDGQSFSKQELLLKSIELNGNPHAFNNLAGTLREDEAIRVGAEKMDAVAMYLAAIRLDPSNARAYNNLGLACKDRVRLPSQELLNRRDLFLRAIQMDSRYANAYRNLAHELCKGETIQLPEGEMVDTKGLLAKAAECPAGDQDLPARRSRKPKCCCVQ